MNFYFYCRLLQQNKKQQEKLLVQQYQYDWKLKQIAAQNKREVPTLDYIRSRNHNKNESNDDSYFPDVSIFFLLILLLIIILII